jgi:hypothetical protein
VNLARKRAQLGFMKRQKDKLRLKCLEDCGFYQDGKHIKKCHSENILTDLLTELQQEEGKIQIYH